MMTKGWTLLATVMLLAPLMAEQRPRIRPPRSPILTASDPQHLTQAEASSPRVLGWDQAADVLATASAYAYSFSTDGGNQAIALTQACAGSASPFTCEAGFTLPAVGQSVGTHTLALTVSNSVGSSSGAMTYIVDPDVQDPCVTAPLQGVSVSKWPSGQTGSKSGTWNSGSAVLVRAAFFWNPQRFEATDTRGCTVTVPR